MRNIKHLIFLFCVLGLLGTTFFHSFPAAAHNGQHTITTTVSDISDDSTLENFVKHAAAHLSEASNFSEALGILNEFRNESGDWNDGSKYLVLLTRDGGVYVHAKNRELEDQDWSELEDDEGNKVGKKFLEGELVTHSTGKAYAHHFKASTVPFANPRSSDMFVLVGGFDYEPEVVGQKKSYEELLESISPERRPHPIKEAREIGGEETREMDKQELKIFVEEAIHFFTWAIAIPDSDIDPVRLRTLFRLDNGPWRHISTYIYIMDGRGNVIFNGANKNIEQTNLLNNPDVGEDIARLIAVAKMPGGGFVEYNWEDPAVEGDGEQYGGPGGDSPKLGYAKVYSSDKGNLSASIYVFGSGLYLGPSEEDDGGCALSGTANRNEGTLLSMLLVISAMLSVVFIRQRCRVAA